MDKEMTFPTEDYISIEEWTTFDTYEPKLVTYYRLRISPLCESEEEAEALKQQILSDHDIVERLKEMMKDIEKSRNEDHEGYNTLMYSMLLPFLKEILEKEK